MLLSIVLESSIALAGLFILLLATTKLGVLVANQTLWATGDGKIFVLDLPECIRIRTGEKGGEAIG